MIRRRLSFDEANRIARELAAGGDAVRALVAELIRINKEHFRLLAHATL